MKLSIEKLHVFPMYQPKLFFLFLCLNVCLFVSLFVCFCFVLFYLFYSFTYIPHCTGFFSTGNRNFFTYVLMSFLRLTVILHENTVKKNIKIGLLLGNYRKNYHKPLNLRENVDNRNSRK